MPSDEQRISNVLIMQYGDEGPGKKQSYVPICLVNDRFLDRYVLLPGQSKFLELVHRAWSGESLRDTLLKIVTLKLRTNQEGVPTNQPQEVSSAATV